MALNQEEIRIRAGLDYNKVTAGLTDIRRQVYKLASDVPSKLGGLLKTTLFGFGASLLAEMAPTWDEIYSKIYGVDDATKAKLEETGSMLEKLRKKITDAKNNLAVTIKELAYKNADDMNKAFQLGLDDAEMAKQEQKIRASIQGWSDHVKRLKNDMADVPARQDEINKAVNAQKGLEADLNNLMADRLKLQDKIGDLFQKMAKQTASMKPEQSAGTSAVDSAVVGQAAAPAAPLTWTEQVAAKDAAWRARGLSWQFPGMNQPQATPSAAPEVGKIVDVRIVEVRTR